MKNPLAKIGPALAALAGVAVYWLGDHRFGPFAAARRYGRADNVDWRFAMPPGEWRWYLASAFVTLAAVSLLFLLRDRATANRPSRRVPWLLPAVIAVLLAGAIRLFVLQGQPLVDDEPAYRFQAETLAGGRLTAPPPPSEQAFDYIFLGVYRDRWFGQYSFGHPALLAAAARLGWMGLTGPLFTGLIVLLVFLLGRGLFDEPTARLAAYFAAASPLLLSTGATLLSQNTATALTLLGIYLALIAARSGRFWHVFFTSLVFGAALWIRQYEPGIMGLGPLVYLMATWWRRPNRLALIGAAALGAALTLGPMLYLQWKLWGHPFWTNYQAYWWGYLKVAVGSPFGFGAAIETRHTPLLGLWFTLFNLARLDWFLLGLPGGLALAVWGAWKMRGEWARWAVFSGVVLNFAILIFYFWPGVSDTGPLLHHTSGAVLFVFLAAAGLRLAERFRLPAWFWICLPLAAAVTFWPSQLGALYRAAQAGGELPRLARELDLKNAIVFTDKYPWTGHNRCSVYGAPIPRPDLADDVLFLLTQGVPVDLDLAAKAFPRRELYFLRQIDGKVALLPLAEYTGEQSLRDAARDRDLPEP